MRDNDRPLRESSWVLALSVGTLSNWNEGFDERMKPLVIPDRRGKTGKVTASMVKDIIAEAKKWLQKVLFLKEYVL